MIDRKGWIILILCSIALVGNFYISNKNAEAHRKQQEAQRALELKEKSIAESGVTADGEPAAALVVNKDGEDLVPSEPRTLETEKVTFMLNSRSGGIEYAEFKDQLAVGSDTSKVRINRFGDHLIGALTSGADTFIEEPLSVESSDESSVSFLGRTKTGLIVKKVYSLKEADPKSKAAPYGLTLQMTLQNPTDIAVQLGDMALYLGSAAPLYQREWDTQNTFFYRADGEFETTTASWFKGGMFSSAKPYKNKEVTNLEYAGVMNQFFVTQVFQKDVANGKIWAGTKDVDLGLEASEGGGKKKALRGAMGLPTRLLGKGESASYEYDIYMGPKNNPIVRSLGDGRGDVMDYGWFSWIARVLNWGLHFLHDVVFKSLAPVWGWGLSIIVLTVILRTLMWPLQNKSQRTAKRMSKLAPKMKELKEKYPDDPAKVQQETMKMYRDYGVNPLGGCLPMFAQIPLFFGFYKMLQHAVELRGASFLWVDDLSQPDTLHTISMPFSLPFIGDQLPINILPILMAVTMLIQMRMTPQSGDPMQRRIFMLMPLIFFFFCYNFASALALYWTTGNIFAIAQTAFMKTRPDPDLKKVDPSKRKKSMAERVAEMEAQKNQMRKAKGRDVTSTSSDKPKKKRGPKTGG